MTRLLTAVTTILLLAGSQVAAQTALSDSAEVVVKGTIRPKPAPDIPPPPLELFIEPPRIEQIALSPDGSRLAFTTRRYGVPILTTYVVADNTNHFIKLGDDALSAITWLDNDYILLSQTQTGLRSTCPTAEGLNYEVAQAKVDPRILLFKMGIPASAVAALTPPQCASYGVRSHDAATVINVRTQKPIQMGNRMSGDYYSMAFGLPKPILVDGKMQLVGPFLELRDKPIGGQVVQRVYLWRVDPDTGKGRIVNDGGGDPDRMGSYVDDWLIDSDGKPIARTAYEYLAATFTIQTLKGGKWTPILKRKIDRKAHTFAPSLVGLGRDGQSLLILDAVVQADGSKRFHYYELATDGTLSEALDTRDATRDRPIFHPQTGALAGFEHDGEATTYTFFDPDLAEYYKLALEMAPGKTVRVAGLAKTLDQMILFTQGGDDVGSWHYYDFATNRRVDIGSQYPSVPTEWVGPQRAVRYKARDGKDIRAILTLPPQGEAKNRALIVLPHDGPLDHDRRSYDWLAQVLASRGYVVLQPNYRGSDGYDVAFTEAGYGEWSGRMLSDMADGITYLAGKGIADPKRVCIAGQGYGGYAALASATGPSPYRCAAAINGISDPADYLKTAGQTALADDIAALKADPMHPRVFKADAASPSLAQRYFGSQTPATISAASVNIPVLLVHAQYDKSVPNDQSQALNNRLQSAGKASTYVELEGCGHDLDTPACRLGAAKAMVTFLAVNNPAK